MAQPSSKRSLSLTIFSWWSSAIEELGARSWELGGATPLIWWGEAPEEPNGSTKDNPQKRQRSMSKTSRRAEPFGNASPFPGVYGVALES